MIRYGIDFKRIACLVIMAFHLSLNELYIFNKKGLTSNGACEP